MPARRALRGPILANWWNVGPIRLNWWCAGLCPANGGVAFGHFGERFASGNTRSARFLVFLGAKRSQQRSVPARASGRAPQAPPGSAPAVERSGTFQRGQRLATLQQRSVPATASGRAPKLPLGSAPAVKQSGTYQRGQSLATFQ